MTQDEAAAAWRLYNANWIAIAALVLALAAGLALTDFSVKPESLMLPLGAAAASVGIAVALMALVRRGDLMPAFIFATLAQLIMVSAPMVALTYLAAGAGFPLQDANLLALDKMFGLDWRSFLDFVNTHPAIGAALGHAYDALRWALVLVPLALAVARRYVRMQQFTLALALALSAMTLISIFVPALGTFHALGLTAKDSTSVIPAGYLDQLRDLPLVRSGALRMLDIDRLVGVIAFPSFHATSALLYAWALWPIRVLRAPNLAINGAMLAATPIVGGHYFMDVFAGLALASCAIMAATRIGAWLTRPAAQPVMPLADAAVPAE